MIETHRPVSSSTVITFERGKTKNAPPPAGSVMMAQNLGFTTQKGESQLFLVILMLS